ncbi:MAG: hypothetical protein JSU07_02165 [Bacteroidetes bacterium]|nr:hypothetical protein [Bacteroidota bacterium]
MQKTQFLKYVTNPLDLNNESTLSLKKIVKRFPYFEAASVLLTLSGKKYNQIDYSNSLALTALVSSNRPHLYNIIHLPEKTENPLVVIENITIPPSPETNKNEPVDEIDFKIEKTISTEETITAQIEIDIEKSVINALVEKQLNELSPISIKEVEPIKENILPEKAEKSFSDWLIALQKNTTTVFEKEKIIPLENKPSETVIKKEKQRAILDKIITTNPGAIRPKEDKKIFNSLKQAKDSIIEDEGLVTETLAKIYALQGSISKAKRAYEILAIKHPNKRVYYENLIQELKAE